MVAVQEWQEWLYNLIAACSAMKHSGVLYLCSGLQNFLVFNDGDRLEQLP